MMPGGAKSVGIRLEERLNCRDGEPAKAHRFVVEDGVVVTIDLIDQEEVIFLAPDNFPVINGGAHKFELGRGEANLFLALAHHGIFDPLTGSDVATDRRDKLAGILAVGSLLYKTKLPFCINQLPNDDAVEETITVSPGFAHNFEGAILRRNDVDLLVGHTAILRFRFFAPATWRQIGRPA